MIVVINPSNASGFSFKGLNAYCSHDQDNAATAERVDWIEGRNLATDDPSQAWKIMAATARAQNDLKAAAGIRAGRASKNGPVLHVVMSFDKDEPQDRAAMMAAADELLSQLGADPAKMRGKAKPKRRQFADEHQAMIYAHNDGTSGRHLHLMVNRVHPETGLNLPTSNDQLKAQKWALDYSKRHGTAHKTPARAENNRDRKAGEYVKANRRKSRNVYELEKALGKPGNDNAKAAGLREELRKKAAALALRGRNLAKIQRQERDRLADGHKQRKTALARDLQRKINQAKTAVREAYRPKWRSLERRQAKERQTFEALEKSFFGRIGNTFKTVKLSQRIRDDDRSGVITRTFRILSNGGDRKAYFDKAQERARTALKGEQRKALASEREKLQSAQAGKYGRLRAAYFDERSKLRASQATAQAALKQDWKDRAAERDKALKAFEMAQTFKAATAPPSGGKARTDDQYRAALVERYRRAVDPDRQPAKEQDNERDTDKDGRGR